MIHTESLVTDTIDSKKLDIVRPQHCIKFIKKSISSFYTNPVSLKRDLVSTNLKKSL